MICVRAQCNLKYFVLGAQHSTGEYFRLNTLADVRVPIEISHWTRDTDTHVRARAVYDGAAEARELGGLFGNYPATESYIARSAYKDISN